MSEVLDELNESKVQIVSTQLEILVCILGKSSSREEELKDY